MLRLFSLRGSFRGFSTASRALQSLCKPGTVLNLKIRKNGDEPVALEDAEYPAWLWDTLDKQKLDDTLKASDMMKWRRKQLNKANTKKIKNNNFLAQLK